MWISGSKLSVEDLVSQYLYRYHGNKKKYYSLINFLHFYSSWTLSKPIMCLSVYFDLLLNWQQLLKSSFSDSFWSVSESCQVCPSLRAWDFKIMSFCLVFPPGKGSVTVIEALLPQAVYTHTPTHTHRHARCVIRNFSCSCIVPDFMFDSVFFYHPNVITCPNESFVFGLVVACLHLSPLVTM